MASNRISCLPVFLLVGLVVLALGAGSARSAMVGASRGGHVGGSGGGARAGTALPHAGVASRPFASRPVGHHRFGDGRHDRRHFFPYVAGVPGDDWYWYDQDYGYESPGPYRRGAQHSGYCDVSSNSYPQNCVWKEGP